MQATLKRWGSDRAAQLAALPLFDPITERKAAALRGDITADTRRIEAELAAQNPAGLTWADMAVLTTVPTPMRKLGQIVRYLADTGEYA